VVTEDSVRFVSGTYPGVIVTVPEASFETVQKNWKKVLESGTKSKVVYENGEYFIFGAMLKSVSETPVNVYSRLSIVDSLSRLMVSVELKKNVYISKSSGETELTVTKSFLKDFAKEQYIEFAGEELKTEEKKLKDLEKELSDLQKDESDLEKAIRTSESTIKDEKDNLIVLNNQLNALSAEIISQSAEVNAMAEGTAKEERSKYLKDIEKQKTKASRDIESSEKKISKAESTIENSNDAIPEKKSLQEEVKKKITAQEEVVRKFENKLNTIKAY
jgi:peptidoglycan hydrolase CwlO-like protein